MDCTWPPQPHRDSLRGHISVVCVDSVGGCGCDVWWGPHPQTPPKIVFISIFVFPNTILTALFTAGVPVAAARPSLKTSNACFHVTLCILKERKGFCLKQRGRFGGGRGGVWYGRHTTEEER